MARVEAGMVELPLTKKRRLQADYGLSPEQAEFIHEDVATADLFEDTVKAGASAKNVASWLSSDVRKLLNRENLTLGDSPLSAERLSSLLALIEQGRISGKIAKNVLEKVFSENADPETIVENEGWSQISDPVELGSLIDTVFEKHPDVVTAVVEGDKKQRGWLMGQVMKASDGKAAPELSGRILDEKLGALA